MALKKIKLKNALLFDTRPLPYTVKETNSQIHIKKSSETIRKLSDSQGIPLFFLHTGESEARALGTITQIKKEIGQDGVEKAYATEIQVDSEIYDSEIKGKPVGFSVESKNLAISEDNLIKISDNPRVYEVKQLDILGFSIVPDPRHGERIGMLQDSGGGILIQNKLIPEFQILIDSEENTMSTSMLEEIKKVVRQTMLDKKDTECSDKVQKDEEDLEDSKEKEKEKEKDKEASSKEDESKKKHVEDAKSSDDSTSDLSKLLMGVLDSEAFNLKLSNKIAKQVEDSLKNQVIPELGKAIVEVTKEQSSKKIEDSREGTTPDPKKATPEPEQKSKLTYIL